VAQKDRWRIRFAQPGITSGALSTAANLIFHGSNDGTFSAYTADTGEKLWSVQLSPGFANPITYMLDGKQYVSILTGRGGAQAPGRVYTFALDAKSPLPSMEPPPESEDPMRRAAAATVLAEFERAGLPPAPGRDLMQKLCVGCHSPTVITKFRQSEEGWRLIVRDMVNRGMPGTQEQREAVIKYLAEHLGPAGSQ
jgi:quinohemoprotein ethanol dehydrogenase